MPHPNSLKNLITFPKGHKFGVGNKYRAGKKLSEEHKKALISSRLGKTNSSLQRRRASEANLGNKHWLGRKHSEESKLKIAKSHKGIRPPLETRMKVSGENNWNWKGGLTPLRKKLYFSEEYKLWRQAVFRKDNYTCVWCRANRSNQADKRVELSADHIKPWSLYPELRFELSNGRTLCTDCHKKN